MLAGFLQFAPLANRALQGLALLPPSPAATIMRWVVASLAVAGSYHAVSAASAILASPSTISGAVGARLSYQIKIYDGTSRLPESWVVAGKTFVSGRGSTTLGLPPGLSLNLATAIISGVPTAGGTFPVSITAYEHPNLTGAHLAFTLTFTIAGGTSPPTITTQPSGGTVEVGDPFTLSVVASGSGTLSYPWQHAGGSIQGATATTLALNSVQTSDAGVYTVVVSNDAGSVTSNPATLTVSTPVNPVSITAQPVSVSLHPGEPLALSVVATGTGPLQYQWQHGGVDLPGQTAATLTLDGVTLPDAGDYTATVSGPSGSVMSSVATVTVVPLMITVLGIDSGGALLRVETIPGQNYVIEGRNALDASSWTVVSEVTATESTITVVDSQVGPGERERFWRCRAVSSQ